MRRRVGRRISRFPLVLPALTPRTPPLPRKATIVEQLSKYREDLERAREAVEGDDDGKSLFHLDASGATAFSAPEAARASEYLASSRFLDAVKRSLQTKRFELPQQSAAVSAHFCNESVYGNLNVLCVTGVVRLDPNADVGGDDATPVTLDWPSEATRAAAKRARKKLLKGPANYPGPWND